MTLYCLPVKKFVHELWISHGRNTVLWFWINRDSGYLPFSTGCSLQRRWHALPAASTVGCMLGSPPVIHTFPVPLQQSSVCHANLPLYRLWTLFAAITYLRALLDMTSNASVAALCEDRTSLT